MTFNLFGRVVIGSLREATAHKLNKEYQREENNEWENNNYVDGVTLKGTSLVPQTGLGMCTGNKGELTLTSHSRAAKQSFCMCVIPG